METNTAVSVIATVLNEADTIDALIGSLMQQKLMPAEVIIVDGGSTDETWEKLQAAKSQYPNLIPIRDESCKLPSSPGPISRGRNVAIAGASFAIVACADAGCTYDRDWLENLTASIRSGEAGYAVGGSCIDPEHRTVWDIASAPFLGVKLRADATTKSCTARSMAFRKELWQRVGGFPEDIFFGEDTVFDLKMRAQVAPDFVERAKAFYQPRHTFLSALGRLASYSVSDGVAGVRRSRLLRNLARCVVEILVLLALPRTAIPLLCVLALEIYFAFRLDWRDLGSAPLWAFPARLLFSLLVPWVVTWNHIVGMITKANPPNRQ
ncbi:MAG TPA: glycosyltransferase, partial [Candidatus Sulfotelmatobacter sp.]|nr:glycosyltransferase [Candidatus Sulfotelmatobacter sp.]